MFMNCVYGKVMKIKIHLTPDLFYFAGAPSSSRRKQRNFGKASWEKFSFSVRVLFISLKAKHD